MSFLKWLMRRWSNEDDESNSKEQQIDENSGQTALNIKTIFHEEDASKFSAVSNDCLDHGVCTTVRGLTVGTAIQMYQTTDKYADFSLKEQCARFLADHLSPENAFEMLVMSDHHNDPKFKKHVLEYIIGGNVRFSKKTVKNFGLNNHRLAAEVLLSFCDWQEKKALERKNGKEKS